VHRSTTNPHPEVPQPTKHRKDLKFRARNIMVRPKASDRNKTLASCFADTVTIELPKNHSYMDQSLQSSVDCKGPRSIFAVLVNCLPNIVRESKYQACINRKGLTEVELNKVLAARGYESCRRRICNDSSLTWHREWYGRRWVNGSNPDDIEHVKRGIRALHHFPEARSLTLDKIHFVLLGFASIAVK